MVTLYRPMHCWTVSLCHRPTWNLWCILQRYIACSSPLKGMVCHSAGSSLRWGSEVAVQAKDFTRQCSTTTAGQVQLHTVHMLCSPDESWVVLQTEAEDFTCQCSTTTLRQVQLPNVHMLCSPDESWVVLQTAAGGFACQCSTTALGQVQLHTVYTLCSPDACWAVVQLHTAFLLCRPD